MLGAETGPRTGVDADTRVDRAGGRLESSADVTEETIAHAVRIDDSSGGPDEIGVFAHRPRIGRRALATREPSSQGSADASPIEHQADRRLACRPATVGTASAPRYGRGMHDEVLPRVKALWWEGPAGLGYALFAFGTSVLLFEFVEDDASAAWRWAVLVVVILGFLIGAVVFARWAGRYRRAVREAATSTASSLSP